jgi:hypothetical protein
MGYEEQNRLTNDLAFQMRIQACLIEQATDNYRNAADPSYVALANDIIKNSGGGVSLNTFYSLVGTAPGLADDAVGTPPDEFDSSRVTDAQIMSAVQGEWPYVANLFFPTA